VIVPGPRTDQRFVRLASRRLYGPLLEAGLRIYEYQPGMTHLKAMLIDDRYLVAGSSNFDYLSYRLYQEFIAIITDGRLIADFRERVMLPDIANSLAVAGDASTMGRQWLNLQTRMVEAALTILT